MTGIVVTVVAIYLAFVGTLFVIQRSLLYYPDSTPAGPPSRAGVAEMRVVTLTTEDGLAITSWLHPPSAGKPTLVYAHGNAGSINGRADKVRPYLNAGYGVVLVGYRGYGGNPGAPDEAGLYADARVVLGHLTGGGTPSHDIILYGESLGTGVAVQMAMEMAEQGTPAGAVVLEAPFSSMGDAAQAHYPIVPARWLVRDRYDSQSKIRRIQAPLLIFHGDRDRTVPAKLGRRLFKAAAEPKSFEGFPDASHNDLYEFGAARKVLEFIDRVHSEN